MKHIISASLIAITMFFTMLVHAGESKISYPENYRNWFHVKSMLIQPGHALENPFQGIHHIYANKQALKGLRKGNFQDGSVLVFDLLNYKSGDLVIVEGDRKLTGVMVKHTKKFSTTGGWGFEGFAGDSTDQRLVNDGGAGCFGCHQDGAKDTDYVFSQLRWRVL